MKKKIETLQKQNDLLRGWMREDAKKIAELKSQIEMLKLVLEVSDHRHNSMQMLLEVKDLRISDLMLMLSKPETPSKVVHLYPFDQMTREEIEGLAFDSDTPEDLAAAAFEYLKKAA